MHTKQITLFSASITASISSSLWLRHFWNKDFAINEKPFKHFICFGIGCFTRYSIPSWDVVTFLFSIMYVRNYILFLRKLHVLKLISRPYSSPFAVIITSSLCGSAISFLVKSQKIALTWRWKTPAEFDKMIREKNRSLNLPLKI